MTQTHWTFAADKACAADARALLRAALEGVVQDQRDIAVLLASELLSNAILHGAAPIDLDLDLEQESVRVTVHDAGGSLPIRASMSRDRPSGRGLLIVEMLSRRWGVTVEPDGKSVWFEVPIS